MGSASFLSEELRATKSLASSRPFPGLPNGENQQAPLHDFSLVAVMSLAFVTLNSITDDFTKKSQRLRQPQNIIEESLHSKPMKIERGLLYRKKPGHKFQKISYRLSTIAHVAFMSASASNFILQNRNPTWTITSFRDCLRVEQLTLASSVERFVNLRGSRMMNIICPIPCLTTIQASAGLMIYHPDNP